MQSENDPFAAAPASPPRSASLPPGLCAGMRVAGKYELTRKLGSGAMGEVWAAKHLSLDEEVAIKLVMRDVAHEDGTTAESRFRLEARVAASLSRKTRHIVGVTDHGEDGPLAYLVMELLEGESLDARLARTGPLPLAKVVPLVSQIARGLSVAHAEGIVHRDLKPSNVFVTKDEDGKALVKILDFGIAKLRASMRAMPVAANSSVAEAAAHATLHGFLLGTPAFMSPEQGKGRANIDHRADVWALGVIAYHLLTGEYPFEGATFEELLQRLSRARHVPIRDRRPDLPEIVGDFFARAFAPALDQRFRSAATFASAFEQLEPLAANRALSLPPPPPAIKPASSSPALETGSVVAAGVPPRGRVWGLLAGGALVATVLAGTAALVSVYLEREPAPGAKLTAGATVVPREREAIPPPPPEVAATPVSDLPAAADVVNAPAAARAFSPTLTSAPVAAAAKETATPAALAPTAVPAAPPSPTQAVAPARGPVDKSEIF